MAGTLSLGTSTLPDGSTVSFELDYDDSLRATGLRCDNKSSQNAFCKVAGVDAAGVESATAVYGESFPPNVNGNPSLIGIDTTPANKVIQLAPNANKPGKYTGFNTYTTVPG